MNMQWKKLGGYNKDLTTGEDTEFGWRVFVSGLRTVVDRQANSWHLGYSTIEANKDLMHRHNDPILSQYIPQMHFTRSQRDFDWLIPTYQVLLDVRDSDLKAVLSARTKLLSLPGTNVEITLLADWEILKQRFSPIDDKYADLREIQNWLVGDKQYSFKNIKADMQLQIDDLLDQFKICSTPYYIFAHANAKVDLKSLVDYLLKSEQGFVGVVDKFDLRAFVVFSPAFSRARNTKGNTYRNIEKQWGVLWLNDDQFAALNQGRDNKWLRLGRYLKREGKKVNSLHQLRIFLGKLISLLSRKLINRG